MPVWSLAFSTSGNRLLTGCEDGIGRIFDCNTGEPICNNLRASGTVMDVAFTRNGHLAVTASAGSSARLWDLADLQEIGSTILDNQAVKCVAFSPDSQVLALGCEDGVIHFWKRSQQKLEDLTLNHKSPIRTLTWSKDGSTLLTGGDDKTAKLWEYPTGNLLATIPHAGQIYAAVPLQQGFLTGQHKGGVLQLDKSGFPVGNVLETKKTSVTSLAATLDGSSVWVGTPREEVWCTQLGTGDILRTFDHKGDATHVSLSPDGATLLVGQLFKPEVEFWDVSTGRPKGPPLLVNGRGILAACFRPDGQTVLVCNGEGGRLWDIKTGKPIGPILPEPKCLAGASSPDGKTVVTAGKYGARFWPTFSPLTGPVDSVRRDMEALTGLQLNRDGTIREPEAESAKPK